MGIYFSHSINFDVLVCSNSIFNQLVYFHKVLRGKSQTRLSVSQFVQDDSNEDSSVVFLVLSSASTCMLSFQIFIENLYAKLYFGKTLMQVD